MTNNARTETDRWTIRPLRPMGAEIESCDLAAVGDAAFAEIRAALLNHKLLVFRDQSLTERQQLAFSRRFGPVQVHVLNQYTKPETPEVFVITNIGPDGKPTGALPDRGALDWHIDGTWSELPGAITMLYAIEVPQAGGDTLFADTAAAYDALDAAEKARLAGARAIHSLDQSRRRSGDPNQMTEAQRKAAPPVEHPVVCTHPDTGVKSLLLGSHAWRIAGMPEAEGEAEVRRLDAHTTQDRFVYRHKWRSNDFVIWDNRNLMHKATPYDAATERRLIRRTTTLSDSPPA